MPDIASHLKRAGRNAPAPGFDLEDVRARRERRERNRRVRAGVLGASITAGLVVGSVTLLGSSADPVAVRDGGTGLPVAQQPARALEAGEFSYQRVWIYETCGEPDLSPDAPCVQTRLHLESWWALDDAGRREVLESHGYGLRETGRFGPGEFPDEGDLTGFPTDPEALEAFLLERSAPDGSSPRPEVTPGPGIPMEEGWIWNAVQDYLGSTQYLNATPELRAAMLRVLAGVPMVDVRPSSTDPLGRAAIVLAFVAYGADTQVFVDPVSGDFLAMTSRYEAGSLPSVSGDDGDAVMSVRLIEEAGFTPTDDAQPRGEDRTVAPA